MVQRKMSRPTSASPQAISASSPKARAGFSTAVTNSPRSHRRTVFAVLHRQEDAGAVVEAGAILFGPVVDALAGDDFLFAHEGLTDRLAEFRRSRLCRLQRHRNDALEHFKGI